MNDATMAAVAAGSIVYMLVVLAISIVVLIGLWKVFDKGVGFGIGILFLPFSFLPMLGFGDAQYVGPSNG